MERLAEDIKDIKEDVKDLDDRVTEVEKEQVKFDVLIPQLIETQKELSKSNKLLVETLTDVKFTMVEMKHSIECSNKEISTMKSDISDIRDAFEEEKEARTINVNEVIKENTKKKLTTGQKVAIGAGGTIGGGAIILVLIKVIEALIPLISK